MKNFNNKIEKRIGFICKLLIFIFILSYFFITTQVASSESIETSIIYVDKYNAGNFSSIQEGIDAAKKGDKIVVYSGIYYENIVIDKSITLICENKNSTIIDGRETGNVIKINANNVTIIGFKIQHSGLFFPNSGINISSNNNIIEGNNIIDNFYGMTVYNSSYNILKDNLIQNDNHCGIYMSRSSNNKIINNTIENNRYNGIGIYDNSNSNIIQNNNLTQNNYCGVNIRKSSNNTIAGNNLSNNNIGIHLPNTENIFYDNTFSNNKINIDREFFSKETDNILLIIVIFTLLILTFFILKKKILKK